ncbi:hypothetical protein Ddye_014022 [Dipteronia dyeriana]|uniref:Cyclic nucleotide-binding domain-containing protein n=1 Tax=Dipteronia dyeriana TaxID=168575 RepID=A0AAD9X768_9ROSI|nr:hypothetical protein Ddye_014022 [Dipteronia dyeriana]
MEEELLHELCDYSKPIAYTKHTEIVPRGSSIDEMLFLMKGKLRAYSLKRVDTSSATNPPPFETSINHLEEGEFCGELVAWLQTDLYSSKLPISVRNIQTITKVDALALMSYGLQNVFIKHQTPLRTSTQVQAPLSADSQPQAPPPPAEPLAQQPADDNVFDRLKTTLTAPEHRRLWKVEDYDDDGTFEDNDGSRSLKTTKENRIGEEADLLVKVPEHFPAKINSTSSTVAIKCIKEKLTEAKLTLFRTTCFGKLLQMHELKFSSQLVHHLLLRQIESHNKSEMWFAVGGKTFQFSIEEFYLNTGLECRHDPPLVVKEKRDGSGIFRSSMLNVEVRFNNKTLEAIFKAASSDSDEDMVKLALLYFLETVLFGKIRKSLSEPIMLNF